MNRWMFSSYGAHGAIRFRHSAGLPGGQSPSRRSQRSRCLALSSQVGANGVDRRLVGSHLCPTPFSHLFALYGN